MISCFELTVPRLHREEMLFGGVGFEIEEGAWTEFVGPASSGKSVLFSLLSLRRVAEEGRLVVAGRNIDRLAPAGRAKLRRSMGTFGEDFRLFDDRTVEENVAAPSAVRGEAGRALAAVETTLDHLWNDDERRGVPVGRLTERYRRRVALMRAVAGTPRLVVLDSPLRGVDREWGAEYVEALRRCREQGSTVVLLGDAPVDGGPDDRRMLRLAPPAIHAQTEDAPPP